MLTVPRFAMRICKGSGPSMLSVIIPTDGVEQPAVATLAALVPGAAAGVVREVLLVDRPGSGVIEPVAGGARRGGDRRGGGRPRLPLRAVRGLPCRRPCRRRPAGAFALADVPARRRR